MSGRGRSGGLTNAQQLRVASLVSAPGKLALASVRNPTALALAVRRVMQARTRCVSLAMFGDSMTQGTGATAIGTLPTNSIAAHDFALPGVIRRLLDAANGSQGGGGYIAASDQGIWAANVTHAGSPPLGLAYGPHVALNMNSAVFLSSTGQSVTIALPACTDIDILVWENTATNYGTPSCQFDVSVDGGAAVTYTGQGGTSVYRLLNALANCHGLSDATHTINIAWKAVNNCIAGVIFRRATGINVFNFGVGSATTHDLLGVSNGTVGNVSAAQTDRVQRASFQVIPFDVATIEIGHNDCSQQAARGLTPAVTAANVQTAISLLRANPGSPTILLLTGAWPNATQTPYTYQDYWEPIMALTDGTTDVAALRTSDILGTYTQGNAEGLYSDTTHPNSAGYAVWGGAIAQLLSTARAY